MTWITRYEFCIVLVTLLFLAAFALNLSPYLRGPDEWRWVYATPGRSDRLWIVVLTLSLYLILALMWVRQATGRARPSSHEGGTARWRRRAILLALVLAVPLIQISLLSVEHRDFLKPLFYRTVSAGASGVFSVGSTIEDAGDFLRHYPALMPTFPVHPQRYPPGLPLLFYLARRVLEAAPRVSDAVGFPLRRYQCHEPSLMRLSNATIGSAIIQMGLPLASALTLLPLYGLARRAYGRRTAAWAVALYPLVPCFALWSARWEQLYPLLTCTSWYFLHVGLTDARRAALLIAGFTLSIASLLNFSILAVLLPMGLFALLWWLTQPSTTRSRPTEHASTDLNQVPRRSLRSATWDLLAFLVGLASLWIAYQLAFDTGFFDIWRISMSYHLGLKRGYWTWLGYHLYDFFIFLGLPLALLFWAMLVRGIRDLRQRRYDALTLGFALGLLILNLSGTSRGEVARVWLFLTPLAALAGARGLTRLHLGQRGFAIVAGLMALQLLTFNTFLRVVTNGLTDPPTRTRVFDVPPIAHPLDVHFVAGGVESMALLGYDLEPETPAPGDTLHLTLYWQSLKPMTQPYTAFTHLVGQDGQLIGQQDNMPLRGTAPTTCWVPGEIIADPYDIAIDRGAPPGDYVLETGFYRWETGERLPVTGPAAAPDGRVVLTQVPVGQR